MKERTVSRRNFTGAFWGGVLGILACRYLCPIALPFGCFFGVVVGWWYQEIWKSALDSFQRVAAGTRVRRTKIRSKMHPKIRLVNFARAARRQLTVITFIALNALWIIPLGTFAYSMNQASIAASGSGSAIALLLSFFWFEGACITVIIPPLFLGTDWNMPEKWKFDRVWEQHIASDSLRLFVKDLVNLFLCEIGLLLFVWGALVWFTGIGGIFLLLVVAPISLMVGAAKGIYEVSMRSGHWLCFGTTVVITAFAARIAHPYLNDTMAIWVVALSTGLASAVATEGLRRALVRFFTFNRRAQAMVSTKLFAQLAPSGHAFWQTTTTIGGRVWDALPITA